MATILREPYKVDQYRRPYAQVDPIPNLLVRLSTTKPFVAGSSQPDRFWPRPPIQDFQQQGFGTRGIPAGTRDPNIFRAPVKTDQYRRYYPQIEQQSSVVLKTLVAPAPPFTLDQFPEIYRRSLGDSYGFEWMSYLPGPVILPYFPVDFPTPMRARAVPQDFILSSAVIPPAKPFAQVDWPIPLRLRGYHQDFWWSGVTTQGIPHGLSEPFNQADWPITLRKRDAYSESYSSPQMLLVTPVLRPFSQSDWVNPTRFRPIPIDWPWSGVTTRGIPPIPSPGGPFASVVLEAYGIGLDTVELHWTASLGAAGYRIYIDGVPQPTILHQRIVLVTGLQIDTPYTFNVVCVNAFGVDASMLSNTIPFEHGSNEVADTFKYPWGNTPQTGYVIKVPLDGE